MYVLGSTYVMYICGIYGVFVMCGRYVCSVCGVCVECVYVLCVFGAHVVFVCTISNMYMWCMCAV